MKSLLTKYILPISLSAGFSLSAIAAESDEAATKLSANLGDGEALFHTPSEGVQGPVIAIIEDVNGVEIFATVDGFPAYTFEKDELNVSNCVGVCAEKWPPILIEEDIVVFPEGFASITRQDVNDETVEVFQLTYGGAPLYTWINDEQNSSTATGDGVNDVWVVATPQAIN